MRSPMSCPLCGAAEVTSASGVIWTCNYCKHFGKMEESYPWDTGCNLVTPNVELGEKVIALIEDISPNAEHSVIKRTSRSSL